MEQQNDFTTEEDEGFEEPKKKGFFDFLTGHKEPKSDKINVRSKKMADEGIDVMKLLGGQYKGPEDKNMALDYQFNDYVPIGDTYKPISETYKPSGYKAGEYVPFKYESPGYESASGTLFGEQGKGWENSPVFQKSGMGNILFEGNLAEASINKPTGMSDVLFGTKEQTPTLSPISAMPNEFPMRLPVGEQMPYTRGVLPTSLQPNPLFQSTGPNPLFESVPVAQPAVVQEVPEIVTTQVPVQVPAQMQTVVQQPVQPVVQQPYKRPVGRPRIIRPPKIKRPVGRPRKNSQPMETQMTGVQ